MTDSCRTEWPELSLLGSTRSRDHRPRAGCHREREIHQLRCCNETVSEIVVGRAGCFEPVAVDVFGDPERRDDDAPRDVPRSANVWVERRDSPDKSTQRRLPFAIGRRGGEDAFDSDDPYPKRSSGDARQGRDHLGESSLSRFGGTRTTTRRADHHAGTD